MIVLKDVLAIAGADPEKNRTVFQPICIHVYIFRIYMHDFQVNCLFKDFT